LLKSFRHNANVQTKGFSMRRLLAAALAVAALSAVSAVGPSAPSAQASTYSYDCGVLATGTWCLGTVRHTYYGADATYSGNTVCAKLIRDSDGADLGSSCSVSYVYFGLTPVYLAKPLVYNGSAPHTILGVGYY
jgi:hypothetical protein